MKANVAIILTFILGLTFPISAQYDLLYENHQQDGFNIPRAVADDGQGNTWMAGYFNTSLTLGTITLTNTPNPGQQSLTGFIGKYNSGSNTWLWARKIERASTNSGQVNVSYITDIALDNAGNVYITGYYMGVVRFDQISLSSTKQGQQYTVDIFVAKYNNNGGVVWAKSFGSKAGSDYGNSIALDGSGNVFVGGAFTNRNIYCSNGPTDITDVYLAKLNNTGTTLWQKRYASSSVNCYVNNAGNDLSLDASGNVCMVGHFSGAVSFGTGSMLTISSVNNSVDVFVAKINGSGSTQWVRATGGNSYDYGSAIHVDASGNVYAGGRVGDAFLSKYNASGNLLWSVNPYPASPDFPSYSIQKINPHQGSILVNDAYVGFKTISSSDGSVMTSDSLTGNLSLSSKYHIGDTEIAGSGFVFVVTSSCGEVTIGGTALTSANSCPFNGDNFFLVRNGEAPPAFQQPVQIIDPVESSHPFAADGLQVYPNPAKDQLHITLPEHEKVTTLFIQNQFGRTLWSEKFDSHRRTTTINLDGQSFQSGFYFLICLSNGNVLTSRFVIEK